MPQEMYKKIYWRVQLVSLASGSLSKLMLLAWSLYIPCMAKYQWKAVPFSVFIKIGSYRQEIHLQGTDGELAILKEVFLDRIYTLPEDIAQSVGVVVDAGANIGLTALFYALTYPHAHVYAFEPEPATFALLEKNVKQVPLNNVHLFKTALAGSEKVLDFFVHPTRNLEHSFFNIHTASSKIQVSALSVDSLFDYLGVKKIDVLKLDVEGAEFEIIKNLTRLKDVGFIMGEIHADIALQGPEHIVNSLARSHTTTLVPLATPGRFLFEAVLKDGE